ncbi:MAG TPA: RNA polymerase sigma factor [Verrucomicrobiae bacterium]|nr:RNA polymerase sigma factor [Verrucomicrobiae bacterium]
MTDLQESDVAERFLEQHDEDSFQALFHVFSPQVVAFFRRRGHEKGIAEDLAQEVMLTVYRKAGQVRDQRLFRSWLFMVARHAACRYFTQRAREAPTVDLADIADFVAAPSRNPLGPATEFNDWMKFLDAQERETMTLRFVEEWEYHEIAAAQAIPIGTVQWRVFNSKKKLAAHLSAVRYPERRAA